MNTELVDAEQLQALEECELKINNAWHKGIEASFAKSGPEGSTQIVPNQTFDSRYLQRGLESLLDLLHPFARMRIYKHIPSSG